MKNRSIVLVDLSDRGHHQMYTEVFASILLKKGFQVCTAHPSPEKMSTWAEQNLTDADQKRFQAVKIEVRHRRGTRSRRFLVLNRWLAVRRVILKLPYDPDMVFFTYVDSFRFLPETGKLLKSMLLLLRFLFPWKWVGLYFHPVHMRNSALVQANSDFDFDSVFRLRSGRAIGVLDEGVVQKMEAATPLPVVTFPDFCLTAASDQTKRTEILKKAKGRKIIGLLGTLQKRKGVIGFLELIKQMDEQEYYFILAGQVVEGSYSTPERESLKEFLKSPPENSHVDIEFLPNAMFETLIECCDLLYAMYDQFPHSSNILTKAATHKIPVIVSKGYCMAERVSNWKLGLVAQEGNTPSANAIAIEKFLKQPIHAKHTEYAALHSIQQLDNQLDKLLAHI